MASKYWIKLYHEILDDPKMGRLTDRQYRRVIELFLLAGDCEIDGQLPSLEDINFRLRSSLTVVLVGVGTAEPCRCEPCALTSQAARSVRMQQGFFSGKLLKNSGFQPQN